MVGGQPRPKQGDQGQGKPARNDRPLKQAPEMIGRHLEEAKEADGLDRHYLDPNYGNEFDTRPYGDSNVDDEVDQNE